jgi:hypothetical protein
MADIRNVFISHIHEDDDRLKPLKDLLARAGMTVRDSSIRSENPNNAHNEDYIKQEILGPAIDWASVVVVLISPRTKDSEYVSWEVEYGHQHDKRLVGVWDHGSAESDVPDALAQYADAVVGWNAERIADAINGKINDWTTSDGTTRQPVEIARHNC